MELMSLNLWSHKTSSPVRAGTWSVVQEVLREADSVLLRAGEQPEVGLGRSRTSSLSHS